MLRRVDDEASTGIPRLVRIRRLAIHTVLALVVGVCPRPASGQSTDHPDLVQAIEAYDAGELQRALSLLEAAPALLDPHDSAIRSIYTGLIRFAQGDRSGARRAFVLAVRTEPAMRLDPAIHSPSRVAVFDEARSAVVEELRMAAVAAESSGDPGGALQAWRVVQDAEPDDPQAAERIAALREELRGEAMRRQAELLAEATGDTVQPPPVRMETDPGVEAVEEKEYSAGQALAYGLVVPGLGQFYTGRPVRGLVSLGAAGGILAAGLLSERLEVDCLSVPVNDVCPPGDIADERTRRPYLAPSIAVAAGIALISAIDAFVTARRANASTVSATDSDGGRPRLLLPALSVGPGQLRAELLRVRFR